MEVKEQVLSELRALGEKIVAIENKSGEKVGDLAERLKGVEDKLSKSSLTGDEVETKSIGQKLAENEQYLDFLKRGYRNSGKLEIGNLFEKKSVIVNSGDLFAQNYRVPNISAIYTPLRVRDILRTTVVGSGSSIEFVRESSRTNAAKPQGYNASPAATEAVAKAESLLGFELVPQQFATIATYVNVSRQAVDDSAALARFIDNRLRFFVSTEEERNLILGSDANAELNGLYAAATAYTPNSYSKLDAVRVAIAESEAAGFFPNAVILHPTDYAICEMQKATGGDEQYLISAPRQAGPPTLWGRPVVLSNAMDVGTFLVGDFVNCCELFERASMTVELSREHASNFTSNIVTLLAEERVALAIYEPTGLRKGTLPTGSPA